MYELVINTKDGYKTLTRKQEHECMDKAFAFMETLPEQHNELCQFFLSMIFERLDGYRKQDRAIKNGAAE